MHYWKIAVIILIIYIFFQLHESNKMQKNLIQENQQLFQANLLLEKKLNQPALIPITPTTPPPDIKYYLETNIDFSQTKFTTEYSGYPHRNLPQKQIFVNPRLIYCSSLSNAKVFILIDCDELNKITIKISEVSSGKIIYYNFQREKVNLWKYESLILAYFDQTKEVTNNGY